MKIAVSLGLAIALSTGLVCNAQQPEARVGQNMRVILLGTQGGPTFSAQRLGIGTLVLAGQERLLFDAGRSITTGLMRADVNPADVTRVFLTHLHSDHVISLPELLISPWASQGRKVPLEVWGPAGTRAMMEKFQEALSFDIHVRRDVDEKFPAEGVRVVAKDIREGTVYESRGVKVTAFLVDHAPVKPAFGYRIDFNGRSVAVFSHYSVDPKSTLPLVRQHYDGPVEFGEDGMAIDIGDRVSIQRFGGPSVSP